MREGEAITLHCDVPFATPRHPPVAWMMAKDVSRTRVCQGVRSHSQVAGQGWQGWVGTASGWAGVAGVGGHTVSSWARVAGVGGHSGELGLGTTTFTRSCVHMRVQGVPAACALLAHPPEEHTWVTAEGTGSGKGT